MILQVNTARTLNEDRAGDILVHLLGDWGLSLSAVLCQGQNCSPSFGEYKSD